MIKDLPPPPHSQGRKGESIEVSKVIVDSTSDSQLGNDVSGSLPNISGTFAALLNSAPTGAFYSRSTSGGGYDNDDWHYNAGFEASRSNSVYSAAAGTDVVRPTSVGVSMWKRIS